MAGYAFLLIHDPRAINDLPEITSFSVGIKAEQVPPPTIGEFPFLSRIYPGK